MNLSSCKKQALAVLIAFSLTACGAAASHAAMISIMSNLGARNLGGSTLIRSSFGGEYGILQSTTRSFTVTADTVADTASFTDMQFGVALTGGDTRSKSSTMVTPPTDFPDPPTISTNTFTETITFNQISPTNLAPQFVSSTVGAITYDHGFQYQFPSNVVITFPGG